MLERKRSQDISRLLVIIRQDARRLKSRVCDKEKEYLQILSMQRTRDHFHAVFKSNFSTITMTELMLLSEELLVSLEDFYNSIDETKWYLNHTQDMPATIEDRIQTMVRELTKKFNQLEMYLNAELDTYENPDY